MRILVKRFESFLPAREACSAYKYLRMILPTESYLSGMDKVPNGGASQQSTEGFFLSN